MKHVFEFVNLDGKETKLSFSHYPKPAFVEAMTDSFGLSYTHTEEPHILVDERKDEAESYFGAGFSLGHLGTDIEDTKHHFERLWRRKEGEL